MTQILHYQTKNIYIQGGGWQLHGKNNIDFHLYHTVFNVADVIYERWNKIPVILKKKAAQLMKLYAFWYHILLRQENHNTTRWAVQVGFLDSK